MGRKNNFSEIEREKRNSFFLLSLLLTLLATESSEVFTSPLFLSFSPLLQQLPVLLLLLQTELEMRNVNGDGYFFGREWIARES